MYLDLAERRGRVVTQTAHLVSGVSVVERMAAEVGVEAQRLARVGVFNILQVCTNETKNEMKSIGNKTKQG